MKPGIKPDYLKIGKIAVGASLAIVIADGIGLHYSASAGVITLLSIQDTRRETIRVTVSRMISFFASLLIAAVSFRICGYRPLAVCVFLLLFTCFCLRFQLMEGLSVNTVLMTHFLGAQSMSGAQIGNESMLLVIGTGMGVLFNLYIPGKEKQIKRTQRQVEEQMRQILRSMWLILAGAWQKDARDEKQLNAALEALDAELVKGERSAFQEMENHFWPAARPPYYLRYMNMRKAQQRVLLRLVRHLRHIKTLPVQAQQIKAVMEQIEGSFHECNNAEGLLKRLDEVKKGMKGQPLPKDREEFENRAVLYQILLELEEFLMIKKEFADSLNEEEIRRFWKAADEKFTDDEKKEA